MKFLLSYFFYIIGDIISKTIMFWYNGYGFKIYNKLMLWSVQLDNKGRIWKHIRTKRKGKIKK